MSFFECPAKPLADRPAHRGCGHLDTRLLFPQLAVMLKGDLLVLFELFPKRPLLLEGGENSSLASHRVPRQEVLTIPPFLQPVFKRRQGEGDAEGFDRLSSRHTSVCGADILTLESFE